MKLSAKAKEIFDEIIKHNGRVYIVGGSVRDEIMQYSSNNDIDVEVYGLTYTKLHDILSKFGYVNTFGKSFAIMQLDCLKGYDFALPRQEYKSGDKHQDFDIIVDPYLPLEKAIQRRDLTMNALMYDYQNHEIIDLCHGQVDIQKRIIRCVNPKSFIEDPLRVLRIAQFVARFDMTVEEKTLALCQQMVKDNMLRHLSIERIYDEYCKILMSPKPSLGFMFLKEINALPSYLKDLTTTYQRLDYHPEGDVFTHTMMVIDVAASMKDQSDYPLSFMWSCLLHDIGKPLVTTKEGHAPLHNEAGVELFKQVKMIQSKKQRQYIQTMIQYHMHLMNMSRNKTRDIKYLRFLKMIEGKVSLNDLMLISRCDKLGRGKVIYEQYYDFEDYMKDKIERLGSQAPKALIDGYDLKENGFQESTRYSEILETAYDLQLQGFHKEKILRSLKKTYEQR